jgi:hypothetical protein
MVRIGATVKADGQFFELPCPAHDGSACTVYEEGPKACVDYECDVLRSVGLGERDADEAVRLIATLKRKIADLESYVGGRDTGSSLNHRMTSFLADTPRDDPDYNVVLLKSAVLNIERAPFDKRAYQDPRDIGE